MSVRKNNICFTKKSAMHIGHGVSGVTGRVDKSDLHLGVIDEQAKEFAGSVAGASDNSYFSFHVILTFRF